MKQMEIPFGTRHYDPECNVKRYETPTGVSLTVPDQAMSMSEILKRYARGLGLGDTKVPLYEEDSELDGEFPVDFQHWDLAEQEEYVEQQKARVRSLQSKMEEQQKAAQGTKAGAPVVSGADQGEQPPRSPRTPKKLPAEGPPGGAPGRAVGDNSPSEE